MYTLPTSTTTTTTFNIIDHLGLVKSPGGGGGVGLVDYFIGCWFLSFVVVFYFYFFQFYRTKWGKVQTTFSFHHSRNMPSAALSIFPAGPALGHTREEGETCGALVKVEAALESVVLQHNPPPDSLRKRCYLQVYRQYLLNMSTWLSASGSPLKLLTFCAGWESVRDRESKQPQTTIPEHLSTCDGSKTVRLYQEIHNTSNWFTNQPTNKTIQIQIITK